MTTDEWESFDNALFKWTGFRVVRYSENAEFNLCGSGPGTIDRDLTLVIGAPVPSGVTDDSPFFVTGEEVDAKLTADHPDALPDRVVMRRT